jgi:glyoxylase-like metal-dependent hydrolase (beta-lactamase superfamily II)
MTIKSFVFNPFGENTYVVSDRSGECIIIDPGCYTREEEQELSDYIREEDLKPVRLLNTHAHLDHILGNEFVCTKWKLLPELHAADLELLRSAHLYGELWGIRATPSPDPVKQLAEGEIILFGNTSLRVLFVPGHCPGHVAFYAEAEKAIISGDVLFRDSIGRTDLPGGDYDILMNSIRERLMTLPDDVQVYSGHGPVTSIGRERNGNPFLLEAL